LAGAHAGGTALGKLGDQYINGPPKLSVGGPVRDPKVAGPVSTIVGFMRKPLLLRILSLE